MICYECRRRGQGREAVAVCQEHRLAATNLVTAQFLVRKTVALAVKHPSSSAESAEARSRQAAEDDKERIDHVATGRVDSLST